MSCIYVFVGLVFIDIKTDSHGLQMQQSAGEDGFGGTFR